MGYQMLDFAKGAGLEKTMDISWEECSGKKLKGGIWNLFRMVGHLLGTVIRDEKSPVTTASG